MSAISPGTELAAYNGLPPLGAAPAFPRLVGYCNVSRVIAVGDDVSSSRVGDRILTFMSHRSHFLVDEADVLLTLDEDDDAAIMACAYLFHLGYNAVLNADVRPGSRVMVLGMGVLGLTSTAMARISGAEVAAISDHDSALNLSMAMGADVALTRAQLATAAHWHGSADAVILTTNGWADWQLALRSARRHGTIACLGFPGRGEPPPADNPFDPHYFYSKQLTIKSVGLSPERQDSRGFLRFNIRDNLAYLAGLFRTGTLDPAMLVSGRYPSERIAEAYADLRVRRGSPVTYLLEWAL